MRKHFTASLSACLVTASFVGCGDKTQDVQVSEQLDTLLDQMSRLQYADAPVEGNTLEYTLGKEVDGVKVPGSTRYEAAYLDQALALLPQAEEILKNGTPLQQQSANAIIGSIRTDEAAFLIDEAERAFQQGAKDVVALRSKLGVLREIRAINDTVAGDRSEIIETYRTGLSVDGATVVGINGLQEQAAAAAELASKASADLSVYNEQMSELRDKVDEYEALELKLTSQARSSQSTDKFDKLDQATAAAKEGELAQAQSEKVTIDAWIAERVAKLEEYKRQQLAGNPQSSIADLLGKLDGFIAEVSTETNIPDSSDVYAGIAQRLATAKAGGGDDVLKAAAFLLAMSEYATADAPDADERGRFVAAMDARINGYLGVIGALEMKIAQIKLDRQRVADKLAEIDNDRQAVLKDLASAFAQKDALIQAAGFDRMSAAIDSLKQAEAAVKRAGSGNDMELMSVYMLHARALQQQSLSARSYLTTLTSIASAGADLLGSDLHTTFSTRAEGLQQLLAEVNAATGDLQTAAGVISTNILTGVDEESARGKIAARQMEVYESLIASLGQAGGALPPVEKPATETPDTPREGGTDEALLGSWRQEIKEIEGQLLPEPIFMTLTFKADGVLTIEVPGPGGAQVTMNGSYSAGDGKITINSPAEFGDEKDNGTYEITGDTVKLVDEDGEVVELTRIQ